MNVIKSIHIKRRFMPRLVTMRYKVRLSMRLRASPPSLVRPLVSFLLLFLFICFN